MEKQQYSKEKPKVWKFVHHEPYIYKSNRIKNREFDSQWLKIEKDGTIIIKGDSNQGFCWNGCSPKFNVLQLTLGTPDGATKKFGYQNYKPYTYYASMVHDAIYQCKSTVPLTRKETDLIFYDLMKDSDFKLSSFYFLAVRTIGWIYRGWTYKPPGNGN